MTIFIKNFLSKLTLTLTLFFSLNSCNSTSPDKHEVTQLQVIAGRDEGEGRQSIYRVQAPIDWIRHDPLPTDHLIDTTKFLCEFIIMEKSEVLRIAIHNFPSAQLTDRIPPEAQVLRWQRQIESLDTLTSKTIPQSFSGYSGLMFYGEGYMQEKEVAVLSWSLQIAPEHYRNLLHAESAKLSTIYSQMRSDITIKAVGPKKLMNKHQQAVSDFARSFELIREIPTRS